MTDAFAARWEELRRLPNHPEMSVFPDRAPAISAADAIDADLELECPKCKYSLRGLNSPYCPECGTHVEFEPVTVFTAADLSLVWAAALLMDRLEISNIIVSASSYDVFLGMFKGPSSHPHLIVPAKFFFEAVHHLEREFGGRYFKAGQKPINRVETADWTCPNCNETNPGSFEVCWKCDQAR